MQGWKKTKYIIHRTNSKTKQANQSQINSKKNDMFQVRNLEIDNVDLEKIWMN